MDFIEVMALIILGYWVTMCVISVRGLSLIPELPVIGKRPISKTTVSVIVAARDEEQSVARAVKKLLLQDYEQYEVIVVNDRSRDRTGEELDALTRWAEQTDTATSLTVVHLDHLLDGWLGKNYALYQGYLRASGDYLLFTDADVLFAPHTLSSAVSYIERHEVDHLTVAPPLLANSFWLRAFVNFFLFSLSLYKRPWTSNTDTRRKGGFGIGAFNFISRGAYENIGTHQAIAMRPDDDLRLGEKVKREGFKQRFATGQNHLQVEWYPNLKAAIIGLEKNIFAGLNYNVPLAVAAVLGLFFFFCFPFIAVWFAHGWPFFVYLLSDIAIVGLYLAYTRKMTSYAGSDVVVLPVAAALLTYVFIRSIFLTVKRGGIYWRGTFYSLRALKKQ